MGCCSLGAAPCFLFIRNIANYAMQGNSRYLQLCDHGDDHGAALGGLVEIAGHGGADGAAHVAVVAALLGGHPVHGIGGDAAQGAQQIINWERIYQKARRHWPSNAAAAAAVADQGSCRKRAKKICWQKFCDCVRRMNT